MLLRDELEERERKLLCEHGMLAAESRGRNVKEPEDVLRTCFQRDRDRIVHSKAFRRLKHKTQVFLSPEGDHYRTRLTHTMEVAQVARVVARALQLNEDLAEACALGHDLGHTPFGHLGEEVLTEKLGRPFIHADQSLRVVERLERGGQGLNLTWEVRDGIACHSWSQPEPNTYEGWVVRYADRIAYLCHDVDDALRAGLIDLGDLPSLVRRKLGEGYSQRLGALVNDLVVASDTAGEIQLTPEMYEAMQVLREFMFERIYKGPEVATEQRAARNVLDSLFDYFMEHPDEMAGDYRNRNDPIDTQVADYISGMTDRFAIKTYVKLFVPSPTN